MGYLPWQRPGFDLGLKLGELAAKNPHFVGVVLGAHGHFTWGRSAKESYQTTLRIINKAADWLDDHRARPSFKGARFESLDAKSRAEVAKRLMPEIRGRISKDERKIGHFTDAPEVLDFVNAQALDELAPLGTSCPDHFLRTKIKPLYVDWDPQSEDVAALKAKLLADPVLWNAKIEALRNVGLEVMEIVKRKDVNELWDAGENLDQACESCHLEYWYPGERALLKKLDAHLEELFGPRTGTTRKLGMEPGANAPPQPRA
jgi:rhamnose utilization protein RhaD (predicted bifunctional aldolase and dehydrogenase)